MGIRVSAGISTHGFALNVNTDLDDFGLIVPCGIVGRRVASVSEIVGHEVPLDDVMDAVEAQFRAAPFHAAESRP
jgi:lipoate-protein ligase B